MHRKVIREFRILRAKFPRSFEETHSKPSQKSVTLFNFFGLFQQLKQANKGEMSQKAQNGFNQHLKTPNNFPLALLALVLARFQLLQKRSHAVAHTVAYYNGGFMPTAPLCRKCLVILVGLLCIVELNSLCGKHDDSGKPCSAMQH